MDWTANYKSLMAGIGQSSNGFLGGALANQAAQADNSFAAALSAQMQQAGNTLAAQLMIGVDPGSDETVDPAAPISDVNQAYMMGRDGIYVYSQMGLQNLTTTVTQVTPPKPKLTTVETIEHKPRVIEFEDE